MHKTDSQLSVIWTAIVDWTVERYFTPARSIDRQELKMTDERRPSSVRQRWIIDHQYTVVLEQRLAVMFIVDTCIQVCSRVEKYMRMYIHIYVTYIGIYIACRCNE